MKEKQSTSSMAMVWAAFGSVASAVSIFVFFVASFKVSSEIILGITGTLVGLIGSLLATYILIYVRRRTIVVFISGAHEDAERLHVLRSTLESYGLRIIDSRTTRIGEDINNSVERAINAADCMIVALSKNTRRSRWVTREIELARSKSKRLYPVILDKVTLPPTISTIRYADLTGSHEPAIEELVLAIRDHYRLDRKS